MLQVIALLMLDVFAGIVTTLWIRVWWAVGGTSGVEYANTPWPLKGNKVQHQALLDCDGAIPVLPLQSMTLVVLYFVGLPLPLDQLARFFLTSAVGIKVNGGGAVTL